MPELPEVENVRRSLMPLLGGRVASLKFSNLAPVETTTPTQIRKHFANSRIVALNRHGKYLLVRNDRGADLVVHLGMSGRLRLHPKAPAAESHTHAVLFLEDGRELHFVDPRRFGTLSLYAEKIPNPFLQRLGPDYLDSELNAEIFERQSRRHPKISLKALTLHQGIAAGLGNIYACEALYHAGLDPRRLVHDTSRKELATLLAASRHVLHLGIAYGGTSLQDYVNGLGHRGEMQKFLQVYGRDGRPNLTGTAPVHRIVQNARATFFCPDLQR